MTQEQSKLAKLGLVAVIVILLGLVAWKVNLLTPTVSSSELTLAPPLYDFGEISMAKGNVTATIALQNNGSEAVKISDVRTSCMCTTATIDGVTFGMHQNPLADFTIPGKSSKSMVVTFDPNAHGPEATGPIARIIQIKTNSEKTPLVEARVSGNVIK